VSDDIIDQIYEAAFVPEMWPDVLESATRVSGSASGALFMFGNGMPVRGHCNERIRGVFEKFVGSDTCEVAPSVKRMMEQRPASFIQVDDVMTPAEIADDPARILLRSVNIGVNACSAITLPSGEVVMFTFNRWLGDGGYDAAMLERLNALRPHLARAGLVAARRQQERAQAAVSALNALGLPAAVLSAGGRVMATNPLLDRMQEMLLPLAFGGMAIADVAADRLFQEAVAATRAAHEPLVRSIPVRPSGGRPAAVVHVLPLRRAAHDIFAGADILVLATEIRPDASVPATRLLSALFDLSPSEARLAAALAAGRTLRNIAAEMNISFASARTYLGRVFQKTGTHQQSELVALLKSASGIPGAEPAP